MNRQQETLFNHAYEKYSLLLWKTIHMYIQDDSECEDILQEVFLKLLLKNPKFKSEEHKRNWLLRVAINKSKDYHRSFWKKNIEVAEKQIELVSDEKETEIQGYIAALPKKYKDVIILHYFFGYSVKEISEILRIGESSVKMRLSRARSKMRTDMEEGDR